MSSNQRGESLRLIKNSLSAPNCWCNRWQIRGHKPGSFKFELLRKLKINRTGCLMVHFASIWNEVKCGADLSLSNFRARFTHQKEGYYLRELWGTVILVYTLKTGSLHDFHGLHFGRTAFFFGHNIHTDVP